MEIQKIISKVLKDRFGINSAIDSETNLIDEFGFESISLVELASALTKETGISIATSQAAKWTTIHSVLGTISANSEAAVANKVQ